MSVHYMCHCMSLPCAFKFNTLGQLAVCVRRQEADSANVTVVSGTHSSDDCAIALSSHCRLHFASSSSSDTSFLLPPPALLIFVFCVSPTQTPMNYSERVALQVFPHLRPFLLPSSLLLPILQFFQPPSGNRIRLICLSQFLLHMS